MKKDKSNKTKSKSITFVCVISLVTGIFLTVLITQIVLRLNKNLLSVTNTSNKNIFSVNYRLINPVLDFDISEHQGFKELKSLHNKTETLIQQLQNSGKVDEVGFYFLDLSTHHWAGVNNENKFDPASMMKIVILMIYYKQAENDPSLLSKKFTYTQTVKNSSNMPFVTPSKLEINKSYTIDELNNYMIVDSDNGAMRLLLDNINHNILGQLFSLLNIPNTDTEPGEYKISAQTYSLFYSNLFNSTYLNNLNSEKVLELLSKTTFIGGLSGGLPEDITIAHKYGEYVVGKNEQISYLELHDCGIVYYPDHPYIICVMTKGKNNQDLHDSIKNISSLVYHEVDRKYKN